MGSHRVRLNWATTTNSRCPQQHAGVDPGVSAGTGIPMGSGQGAAGFVCWQQRPCHSVFVITHGAVFLLHHEASYLPVSGWVTTLGRYGAHLLSTPCHVDGTAPSPLSSGMEQVMNSKLGQPSALCRALMLALGDVVVFNQDAASHIYLWGSSESKTWAWRSDQCECQSRHYSQAVGAQASYLTPPSLFLQWQVRDNTVFSEELLWELKVLGTVFVPGTLCYSHYSQTEANFYSFIKGFFFFFAYYIPHVETGLEYLLKNLNSVIHVQLFSWSLTYLTSLPAKSSHLSFSRYIVSLNIFQIWRIKRWYRKNMPSGCSIYSGGFSWLTWIKQAVIMSCASSKYHPPDAAKAWWQGTAAVWGVKVALSFISIKTRSLLIKQIASCVQ